MASQRDHADAIKAAIEAALDDGFKLEVDLTYRGPYFEVETIDLDLIGEHYLITVFTEDRT